MQLGSFKHLAKRFLPSNQLFVLWGSHKSPMMFSKSKIYFPLWLSELSLAPMFTGGGWALKPYATVVRSRRRGASLGGEVIPDKKKEGSLLSPVEICSVVFLQRAAERCSGGIVTLQLLCMNNISCAIICVFLVTKLHTDTQKNEERLQPWPQSHLSFYTHMLTHTRT